MQSSFNPAAAGKDTKLNINAAYAMTLVGFENAPQTAYISGDMPFQVGEARMGAGLVLVNDKIGLFTHQRFQGQIAYRKQVKGGWLGIGAQAGLLSEKFNASGLDLGEKDAGDYAFPSTDEPGNALDFSLGLYYSRGPWYVGASAQHLTSPTIMLGEYSEFKVDATYYLTGGYTFQLRNPTLSIATSALVRSDIVGYRGDLTGRLIYKYDGKMLYAGLGYSPTNSVTMHVGGMFQGVVLGYSYEFYTSGLSMGDGAHEIYIGYQTDVNLMKKGKNKHQSVRYL